jgi:hypothetical protein
MERVARERARGPHAAAARRRPRYHPPAPAEELEVVRGVSNTAWKNYPAPGRRNSPRRVIGLWVILIFAFLAIWQFLSAR